MLCKLRYYIHTCERNIFLMFHSHHEDVSLTFMNFIGYYVKNWLVHQERQTNRVHLVLQDRFLPFQSNWHWVLANHDLFYYHNEVCSKQIQPKMPDFIWRQLRREGKWFASLPSISHSSGPILMLWHDFLVYYWYTTTT